jgi:uncharacterized membrane protein
MVVGIFNLEAGRAELWRLECNDSDGRTPGGRVCRPERTGEMADEPTNTAPPEGDVVVMRAGPANDTSKWLSALGYIFVLVAVILLFIDPYKDEDFVRFNAWQAIALQVVVWIGAAIPIVGWIVSIVGLVFAIIALVKTIQEEYYEIPIIYPLVKGFIGI